MNYANMVQHICKDHLWESKTVVFNEGGLNLGVKETKIAR